MYNSFRGASCFIAHRSRTGAALFEKMCGSRVIEAKLQFMQQDHCARRLVLMLLPLNLCLEIQCLKELLNYK